MPHFIVKARPGKAEEQERRLSEAIALDVVTILGYEQEAISVAFEEVASNRCKEDVCLPDIRGGLATLCKKSGYKM